MATVNTTSITGSDGISGSRTRINSNIALLENWINNYDTLFGLDTTNGILDLTQASTGRISAKTAKFNSLTIPSGGTALAQINSSGIGSFAGLSTTTLSASGVITLTGSLTQSGSSILTGTLALSGATTLNSSFTLGYLTGSIRSENITIVSGATSGTPFAVNTSDGGGILTTTGSPYAVTGLDDVIYAQCENGFYMSVGTTGGTAANIPAGHRITIVNTQGATGSIKTGVQTEYTGFNTVATYGGFPSTGITVDPSRPYQASLQLQWEPRIGKDTGTEEGSWVILGSSNLSWS